MHVDGNTGSAGEIEALLGRRAIAHESLELEKGIRNRSVMVTGAGGSIGSELCRQVLEFKPKKLVLFEHHEFSLFEVNRDLQKRNGSSGGRGETQILPVIGDVKSKGQVARAFSECSAAGGIDLVYHAAAYKQLSFLENNVATAIENNVLGTHVLAETARENGVVHFVLVSSEKAESPAGIMGASLRLAERVLLEAKQDQNQNGMHAVAVRFGNVLGSSGSVIPIFKRQIADGGPVTVTSPDTRRFFMSIQEAVRLIMIAGITGKAGDILALEMGDPVKIVDLARRLIERSGFKPGEDVKIEFVGLRPGEKEYEEAITAGNDVEPTEHERIWVYKKTSAGSRSQIAPEAIGELRSVVEGGTDDQLRSMIKNLIPEYRIGKEAT